MEWLSAVSAGDAVIVRQDPSAGTRYVVHGSHGPQIACSTYAEAEARAGSYAEHARASVWYVENGQLQLVCSFVRGHAHNGERLLKKDANVSAPAHIENTAEKPA
jgi:hypothetical protein